MLFQTDFFAGEISTTLTSDDVPLHIQIIMGDPDLNNGAATVFFKEAANNPFTLLHGSGASGQPRTQISQLIINGDYNNAPGSS